MRAYKRRKADAAAAGRTFREEEPVLPLARRSKPGMSALRGIKHWQKQTGLIIAKGPFHRVVKEFVSMTPRAHPDLRFMASAVGALQEAAEQFLVGTFEGNTVMPKNFALVRDVTKDRIDWAMMGGNWLDERKAPNPARKGPPPAKKPKRARNADLLTAIRLFFRDDQADFRSPGQERLLVAMAQEVAEVADGRRQVLVV
ncbi:MAG: hypothetical protein M1826_007527 [Phylliscum demangeonii]|nr:MAG: hypothetical protein M1826_007527 [Phylliscum demangeonii]